MKHYALDSSFIINFLAGDKKAAEKVQELSSENLMVPAPSKLETKRGVEDIGAFSELQVGEFGEEESDEALRIVEFLEEEGEMIGIIDVMIASIAVTKSAKILTYDSDFRNLENLKGLEIQVLEDRN